MIVAWLFHAIYSTAIAFALAHVFSGLSIWIAVVSLLVGTWFGAKHARALLANHPELRFFSFHPGEAGILEGVLFVFILYACWRHFLWMLFPSDTTWLTLSANNFGDLPLHINYMRAFANGIAFPPRNPIFANELLRYPYGPDLYNALWEIIGVRTQAHIFLTGLLSASLSLVALRAFASWWGVGAFFLSGGFSGWQILNGVRLSDFQNGIDWKNLLLSVFITQRGMLVALPLGLLLLVCWRKHLSGEAPLTRRQMIGLGLLWGLLPLFHLHAFVAVTLMLVAISLEWGGWKTLIRHFNVPMSWIAIPPATMFILYSTNLMTRTHGIVRWSWGWTMKREQIVSFTWNNFGPWMLVPLVIALALIFSRDIFPRETRRRLWIEFASYLLIFALFFNLMLAPWDWDNIKVIIWPYLGFSRLLWVCVEPRLGHILGPFERPLIGAGLFLSGFVTVLWTLQTPMGRAVPIYQMGDLAYVQGAISDVASDAIFAASPTHQHALTYFGRLRVMGYEGHLWSHGIDASAVSGKLEKLMSGDPDYLKIASDIGVTHIFWGPDERLRYGTQSRPFMTELRNVSRVQGYEVFAIPFDGQGVK